MRIENPDSCEQEEPSDETRVAAKCLDKGLRLLARRQHFRRELEQKLLTRAFPDEVVRTTLDRLTELGYLDDRRCAEERAAGDFRRRGYGPRRMEWELRKRGAGNELAAEVVAERFPDGDLDLAREVAARWQDRGGLDAAVLARHLDRKGFSRGSILKAVRDLESSLGGSDGSAEPDL